MPQLTAADAAKAAGLVLQRMPREHAAIVHSMGSGTELQFMYLKVRQPHKAVVLVHNLRNLSCLVANLRVIPMRTATPRLSCCALASSNSVEAPQWHITQRFVVVMCAFSLQGALEVAQGGNAGAKSSASAALAALDRGDAPASSSRCTAALEARIYPTSSTCAGPRHCVPVSELCCS